MPNFTLENKKVVRVPVVRGQHVVARRGAMIAYTGEVLFYPASSGQDGGGGRPGGGGRIGGLAGMAGRALAGENTPLMVAEGAGEVLYGYAGLEVTVIELDGSQVLSVESDRLLAHDSSVQSAVVFLGQNGGMRGMVRGAVTGQGLFTTQLTGRGSVALLSHGGALALPVNGSLGVDPQAYVAHLGNLNVEVTTLGAGGLLRDAVGRGSGESIQLKVTGAGTVYVQASEQKF
jgi:uncharacterized protein (AIM24 family)